MVPDTAGQNGASTGSEVDPDSVVAGGGSVVEVPETEEKEPPAGEPEATPQERQTRADRRRERGDGMRSFRESFEKSQAELRATIAKQNEAIAELHGRLAGAQAQAPKPDADPYAGVQDRLKKLRAEADAALGVASTTDKPDVARSQMNRYQDLQEEIMDIRSDVKTSMAIEKLRASMPVQDNRPPEYVLLESEYPWLKSHEAARRWATAAEEQLIAEGRPETITTSREALAAAAVKFGLSAAPGKPTPSSQRRFSGSVPRDVGGDDEPQHIAFSAKDMLLIKQYASVRGISVEEATKRMAKLATEKD